jgi:tetratricopeptide (TPR) repeat protein
VVTLLLWAVLLLPQLQVSAHVDRNEVLVGEELTLTITVEGRGGPAPVEIEDPDLVNLEFLGSRDQSRVQMQDGTPARITTREVTLRAVRPGTASVGAVRVRQGDEELETAPIAITVNAPAGDLGGGMAESVEMLVRESVAPELDREQVSLVVLAAPESVVLGQQVDLVVVAWFPRTIRARLRNPPTLESPSLRGAWTYDRPAPAGVLLSRQVRGDWFDLYVLHQVIFPLAAGGLEIGPAKVSFSLPVSSSFLSRELRHEVTSDPLRLAVRPPPPPRGVPGFHGAAGSDLEFRVEVPPGELRLGDAAIVRAVLRGRGNVALWPEPELEWPLGLRAYPQEVSLSIDTDGGLVGGEKRFEYLVVADSAGTHRVPAPSYAYFDVGAGTHVELRAAPVEFVTPSGAAGVMPVETVPRLMDAARSSTELLVGRVSRLGWIVLILAPPLAALVLRTRRRWPRYRGRAAVPESEPMPLAALEIEFGVVLEGLVPAERLRGGDGLADALRAAGVEAPLAAHAARVRDRLRQALYGPQGSTDPDELTAEVSEVLRALRAAAGPTRSTSGTAAGAALALLFVTAAAHAQAPERLYEAGAVRPAADSFARRAASDPSTAAHWYNLGAALDRIGEDVRARAAWLRAAQLAPRDETIRRALDAARLPDAAPSGLIWIAPISPTEAVALAALCWLLGWGLLLFKVRPRRAAPLLLLALAASAYAWSVSGRYARPVALVLLEETPLREAPYGPAGAARELGRAAPVIIEDERGPWLLVSDGVDRGWLLRSELVRL